MSLALEEVPLGCQWNLLRELNRSILRILTSRVVQRENGLWEVGKELMHCLRAVANAGNRSR